MPVPHTNLRLFVLRRDTDICLFDLEKSQCIKIVEDCNVESMDIHIDVVKKVKGWQFEVYYDREEAGEIGALEVRI